MNKIVLRPHHLGEIYGVFAESMSVNMSKPTKNINIINILIRRRIDFFVSSTNYPQKTIDELRSVLLDFFFNDMVVVFRKGIDVICNSGCLLFAKELIAKSDGGEYVKQDRLRTITGLCENDNPKEDVLMAEIFGLEMEKEYGKEELLSKMTKVFEKYKKSSWKYLIELYEAG